MSPLRSGTVSVAQHIYGGHDAGVCAWMMGSQAEWLLGHPDTALSNTTRGITLAERIAHTPSLIFALSSTARVGGRLKWPDAGL